MQLVNRSSLVRLISVASYAASKRGFNTVELARKLEVATKTIHRDREFLRDTLNVDLEQIGNGGQTRWKATNIAQVMPVVKTLERFIQ